MESFTHWLDVDVLIRSFSYPGLFAIVFAETGLLLGFFLPGDSLMITAGILASKGILNIWILLPVLFSAAAIGDGVGYAIGHHFGKKLFNKDDSLFFHKDHLQKAKGFYEKHGKKTIIIARFVPIIRTFAPAVAGIAEMSYATFFLYNVIGALLWAVGLTLFGYFLAKFVPGSLFEVLILLVILASILPGLYHTLNTKEKRETIKTRLSAFFMKQKK